MLKKQWSNMTLSTFSLNCLVVLIVFGGMINFGFIAETWFAPVFGTGPVDDIAAIVSGLILGLGAYGLFIDSETAVKTILKKQSGWEKGFRITGLVVLNLAFIGIAILGLWFRLGFLSSKGIEYLGWAGMILEACPPVIGLVIHPLVHPDLDVLEQERISELGRRTLTEVYDQADKTSASKRFGAVFGEDSLDDLLDGAADDVKQIEGPKFNLSPLTSRLKKKTADKIQPRKVEPETQPLPSPTPTDEEAERAVMQRLMQKYGETPFLTALQNKGR